MSPERAHLRRRILAVLAFAFLGTGCGAIRFQRAWSGYEPPAEPTAMEGRWRGEWRSEWNGHSGGLRCLMTRAEDGRHRAWFYSTYALVLFFQYVTVLDVTAEEAGALRFAGEQDLGQAVGGLYRYEGTVSGDRFEATFHAENGDHGVFEMTRAESE